MAEESELFAMKESRIRAENLAGEKLFGETVTKLAAEQDTPPFLPLKGKKEHELV